MAAYKSMDKPKLVEKMVLQEQNNVQVTGILKNLYIHGQLLLRARVVRSHQKPLSIC